MTPLTPRGPERRKEDRRLSPSIGEFAISEVARLRGENARLRSALSLATRYLEHPDVRAIPFGLNVYAAAERAREALKEQP